MSRRGGGSPCRRGRRAIARRDLARECGLATLAYFVFIILHYLLQALIWLVVAYVLVSWLVAFEVINMRNRLANQIVHLLSSATRPLLWPFRRFIPTLGGLDLSPMLLIILVIAIDQALLPAAINAIFHLT